MSPLEHVGSPMRHLAAITYVSETTIGFLALAPCEAQDGLPVPIGRADAAQCIGKRHVVILNSI